MPKKHLLALFTCTVVSLTTGNALTGLLPVYITRLGGDATASGNYFAFLFVMLAAGSLSAGWVVERFQRRKLLLILCSLPAIPTSWLMSQVTDIGQLALINGVNTFFVGMGAALLNILAGLFVNARERGKIFGILALGGALGGLVGGFASGPIVDRWGFPALFQILAVWSILYPLAAWFAQDKVINRAGARPSSVQRNRFSLGRSFYFLMLAAITAWLVVFVTSLGRPLMMNNLGFDSTAISSTVGIGAAVTLPLPAVIGWLSDRIGRKWCLAIGYLAGGVGILILAASVSVWHFWVSTMLISLIPSVGGVGLAQVSDLVPPELLDTGISLYSSTSFIGGIMGFVAAGQVIQTRGVVPTLLMGAALSLVAVAFLRFIRPPVPAHG